MTTELDQDQVIRQVSGNLRDRFPTTDAVEIERIVTEEVTSLLERPVNDYVAVLSERAAKRRLKSATSSEWVNTVT